MVKILIVDDHEIFCNGIKQILSGMPGKFVIEEANHGNEAMKKMLENYYDAVLLDISMPGRNGIDILKQLKGIKPDLKVLMLSMYPEEQFAIRALKAGAAGYLTKACKPDELVLAIQNLLQGKRYISSSLADRLALYIKEEDRKAPHESLSAREYEVMCMTTAGISVKQIARELSLSDKTISTYRSRILDKLKMDNIAQLIQYAVQNRITEYQNN